MHPRTVHELHAPTATPTLLPSAIGTLALAGFLALSGCASPHKADNHLGDLTLYRQTENQVDHDKVKTIQFTVPVGTVIRIDGLDFKPGVTQLTRVQERIVQQIFTTIEEITEDTLVDPDKARVAEFKQMTFEIRAHPDLQGDRATNAAVAKDRADLIRHTLTNLGTPPWRLSTKVGSRDSRLPGSVVLIRTR